MTKVIVTGANGQVGEGLIPLLRKEYDVIATDIEKPEYEDIQNEVLNITKENDLDRFSDADVLVHLAADSKVEADWNSVLENNIEGVKKTLEAAKKYNVEQVIVASSNHAVGMWEEKEEDLYSQDNDLMVHPREDEFRPDSYYGVSKVFGEALSKFFSEKHGLNIACVRIGNIIENDQIPDTDRDEAVWMSNQDFYRLVKCIIEEGVKYDIFFGVSDNQRRFWSLENTEAIGFKPQDKGEERRKELYRD